MFRHDLLLRATLHDDRRDRIARFAAGTPRPSGTRRGRKLKRRPAST
jgi:hypothetical protein